MGFISYWDLNKYMRDFNVAQLVNFPKFVNKKGSLFVYECGKEITFNIERIFSISANKDDVRGNHAHKNCVQLLICLAGKISVVCDNGLDIVTYVLDGGATGLLIPEGIWSKQKYLIDNSVLIVLCNRRYDDGDYIRNYEEFRDYVGV